MRGARELAFQDAHTLTAGCASTSQASEFLTRDKKNLVIESYVACKVQARSVHRNGGDPFGRKSPHEWLVRRRGARYPRLESIVSPIQTVDTGEMLLMSAGARLASRSLILHRLCRLASAPPAGTEQQSVTPNACRSERIAKHYRAEGERGAEHSRDADRHKERSSIAYKSEHLRVERRRCYATYSQAYAHDTRSHPFRTPVD